MIKPQPLNWKTAMNTSAGLAATITSFLIATQVATRNWTFTNPPEPRVRTRCRMRQGLSLCNDEVVESEGEEDGLDEDYNGRANAPNDWTVETGGGTN